MSDAPQRHHSWVFPHILPVEFCRDQLAAMREATEMKAGRIMGGGGSVNAKVRRSQIGWVDPAKHEICRKVRELVFRANRDANWHIWLSDKVEWQLTHYGAGDQGHYAPHQDSMSGPWKETDRKLSCVVQLSDRASYEGGDFSFEHAGGVDQNRVGHEGTVIVFPSFAVHGVRPVTKGERWSLVSWHSGPNWR